MAFDVRAVANYILDKAQAEGVFVDHMKLQKLCYITHGWHLAIAGDALLANRIEAWKYGPVIRDLYREFRSCGYAPISDARATHLIPGTLRFEPWKIGDTDSETTARSVIDRVWNVYKRFNALELSAMTHQKGTPWYQAWHNKPSDVKDVVIPNELIKQHYLDLASKNRERKTG
jgi:uncharacterized phage-associated protein